MSSLGHVASLDAIFLVCQTREQFAVVPNDSIVDSVEALVVTERRVLRITKQYSNRIKPVESTPKATTAPPVDTRTIGKAPIFTGEHKDWPEWSFQFTAYMGSAKPKSSEALPLQRKRLQLRLRGEQSFEKRPELIAQTTEAVERWECDVREHEQRFGKLLDEDVMIGVILALVPSQVLNRFRLNSHTLDMSEQCCLTIFEH